ncbi:hypothetical protein GGQ88_003774 [Novosphingobium hassiacum]|uniref:Uncharacterized protein n=1 Tax=Novosphingobium hassiacum TaxID=173676 RepID=A0A7W6EXK8_9SPHN|nr:hypothetical protein [Novosphingobium hassiacum]MBB3862473.1 hypothetical protein [Novosphingobium hassiacum]
MQTEQLMRTACEALTIAQTELTVRQELLLHQLCRSSSGEMSEATQLADHALEPCVMQLKQIRFQQFRCAACDRPRGKARCSLTLLG